MHCAHFINIPRIKMSAILLMKNDHYMLLVEIINPYCVPCGRMNRWQLAIIIMNYIKNHMILILHLNNTIFYHHPAFRGVKITERVLEKTKMLAKLHELPKCDGNFGFDGSLTNIGNYDNFVVLFFNLRLFW